MTREEREQAITQLKILKEDYWDDDGYGHETQEYEDTMSALDMAIEALEQYPCEENTCDYLVNGNYVYDGCRGKTIASTFNYFNECDDYIYCPYCGKKIKVVTEG